MATTNMGLVLADLDTTADITIFDDNLDTIDLHDHSNLKGLAVKRVDSGTFASRPAAGNAGHVYVATNTGQFFIDTGAAWVEIAKNPMTAAGDLITGGASGALSRLALGTALQVLRVNAGATAVEWGDSPDPLTLTTAAPATPAADTLYKDSIPKAWVTFDGTAGTIAIADDVNVSSLTDNGTGDYTITFATAFANTNYAALFTAGTTGAFITINAKTTTTCRVLVRDNSGVQLDALVNAVFFGDQ